MFRLLFILIISHVLHLVNSFEKIMLHSRKAGMELFMFNLLLLGLKLEQERIAVLRTVGNNVKLAVNNYPAGLVIPKGNVRSGMLRA